MDKVIIDGVNVSKCGFYHPEYDNYCHIALAFSEDYGECNECKDNPNCYYKQLKRLESEYDDLHLTYAGCKTANTGLQELNQQLQSELQRYKDMEQKGLEEFKDVGGCWGCGLQLQLNQDIEDIKQLKAENERLKQELRAAQMNRITMFEKLDIVNEKDTYKQALQEIRNKLDFNKQELEECLYNPIDDEIREIINSAIGVEE